MIDTKREIKFRAWMPKENKLAYEMTIYETNVDLDKMFNDTSGDGLVWMQYTGLKDKNGKEIYEGDVVKRPNGGNNGEVIWFDGGYWGVNIEISDWSYMFDCNSPEEHEVIGNIYENPELLE